MQVFTVYLFALEIVVGSIGLRLPTRELDMVQPAKEIGKATLTAFCIAGDMRTFPEVGHTLAAALRNSNSTGMQQADTADVFFNVGLRDDPNFGQMYDEDKRLHSDADAKSLGKLLNAVNVNLYDDHGAASIENVHSVEYISKESQDCFGEEAYAKAQKEKPLPYGAFWLDKEHMVRSMNQLQHIKECLTSVKAYEDRNKRKYTVVAIARPDLAYGSSALVGTFEEIAGSENKVAGINDFMFIFPRKLLDNFFTKAGPLTCHPGQACCGRITRSEDMFQFILEMDLSVDNPYKSVGLRDVGVQRPGIPVDNSEIQEALDTKQ